METIIYCNSIEEIKKVCPSYSADFLHLKYVNEISHNSFIDNSSKYPILYLVLKNEHNILGILKQSVVLTFNKNINCRFINYISINDTFKNSGYGSYLIKEYCKFLKINNIKKITASPYSKEGFNFIRKKILQYCKEYDIELIDNYCFEG